MSASLISSLASRGSRSSAARATASVDLPDPGRPPINTNNVLRLAVVIQTIMRHRSPEICAFAIHGVRHRVSARISG
jgi:hypothetical protein